MATRRLPPGGKPGVGYYLDQIRITRRRAVQLLAASAWGAGSAAAQQSPGLAVQPALERVPNLEPLIAIIPRTPTVYRLRRVDDMLIVDVELDNLRITGSGANRVMSRIQANRPGLLIARHPPQAIAEQAFQQVSDQGGNTYAVDSKGNRVSPPPPVVGPQSLPLPPQVAMARISGASRVVFQMPTGVNQAPWGLEGVLEAMRTWPLSLDPLARPAPQDITLQMLLDRPVYRLQQFQLQRGGASLDRARTRLDQLAASVAAQLPQAQQETLALVIPVAAPAIAAEITEAARAGRPLGDAEIDGLVRRELDAGLRGAAAPTIEHRAIAERVLEATAVSAAIAAQQPAAQRATPSTRVAPGAQRQLAPALEAALVSLWPRPPQDTATAIELPYRLIMSPLATAGFTHAVAKITRGSQTELWHTRLGTRTNAGVDDRSSEPIRAIWSPDYQTPVAQPGDWALDATDRASLVKLMAGYNEKTVSNAAYTPRPAVSKRLMLTALGGWLEADGSWPVATLPQNVDLVGWNHRTALARDYYVRVIYAGFLFPFGHAASLIKITERKFERYPQGKGRVAAFRQRFFIIVRERIRNYPGAMQAHSGRDMPFKRVEVLTKITPDLMKPGEGGADNHLINSFYDANAGIAVELRREAFFPVLSATKDFLFDLVGVDGMGRRVPFSAPLMFVSVKRNNAASIGTPTTANTIAWKYSTAKGGARARVSMKGATILFAEQAPGASADADTNVPTDTMTFRGVQPTSGAPGGNPFFLPGVARAEVKLAAARQLLGTGGNPMVEYSPVYLQNGFDAPGTPVNQLKNKGQLFLNLLSTTPLATLGETAPNDKFGGLIQPDVRPSALSRKFGMVAGANNAQAFSGGAFNPADFLPDAKLFGVIKLSDILGAALNFIADETKAPKFTNIELPDRVEATYYIRQGGLKEDPLNLFLPSAGSVFELTSKVVARRDGSPPEASVTGKVNDFKVNLFGFIIIAFDLLGFRSTPGKKPDVDVGIKAQNGIVFGGPLEFVNTLKDLIPASGFADPVPISVSPTGVAASYTLGLPSVVVGICSLQNISFGAGFNLPFTGQPPSVRFNFAERQNPFTVTVSMFGGGGFVAITLDTGGLRELEAALEFGAQISINLGVASGGVYVKGGFYFHWKEQPDRLVYFEGYIEMGGHLSVLCLITVSLVFHLALAYEKTGGKTRLFGQASLKVEIEILFFSTSVTVKVERQFAGSDGDPTFAQLVDQSAWNQYCAAFA